MSAKSKKYLLVKHSKGWDVDRVAAWMRAEGKDHEWCYPADGDSFPDADLYAGVVVFGGAGSANDDVEWVREELKFIERILARDVPFFGICLGGQMLAKVLGAEVSCHPASVREVGFHPVFPTPDSGDFLTETLTVMQWHSEGFSLPDGSVRIASGELFENQAFRYSDRHFAVQFHPEVNPAALEIWQERNKKRESGRLDDCTRKLHMAEAVQHDQQISTWLNDFMYRWTD